MRSNPLTGQPGLNRTIGDAPSERDTTSGLNVMVLALGLVLVAFAARLWRLQFQSMWWDEGVSVYLTTVGLRGLTVAKDFAVDLHPPGYYLLLTLWRAAFGPSVFSDRLLSVFSGTISVPLTFALTRRIGNSSGLNGIRSRDAAWVTLSGLKARSRDGALQCRTEASPGTSVPRPCSWLTSQSFTGTGLAALAAALLAAISPIDVYYSQEIRMYPLLPALGALSLLATLGVLERGKRRDWAIWAIVAAASLYVYYYLGLLVAAEAIALVWPVARRGQLAPWIAANVALALALVPWAALMLTRMGRSDLALPPATEIHLTPLRYLLLNWEDFTVGFDRPAYGQALLVLWLVAVAAGLIVLFQRAPRRATLLVAAVAIPLLGAGAVLLARPFFYPRFILFAAVPVWVLAGLGLTASRRLLPIGLLALAAILIGNAWTWHVERVTPRSGYAPDDYRTVFESMAPVTRPGDVVVGGYPWQAGYVDAYLGQLGVRSAYLPGAVDPARFAQLGQPNGRVWLYTYAPDRRFDGAELTRLAGAGGRTRFIDQYGDSRAALFGFGSAPAVQNAPSDATFGGEIALTAATLDAANPARPGEIVGVTLRWQSLKPPGGSYTVFVHLLGPDGKIQAQKDAPPLGGEAPTNAWQPGEVVVDRYQLRLPADAPPGTYQVEVGMYHPENGRRLVIGPAPRPDDRIIVGEVTVVR